MIFFDKTLQNLLESLIILMKTLNHEIQVEIESELERPDNIPFTVVHSDAESINIPMYFI